MKNVRSIVAAALLALMIGAGLWWHHRSSQTPSLGTNTPSEIAANQTTSPRNSSHEESTNTVDFAANSAQTQRQLAQMGITPGMTKDQIQQKAAEWYRSQRERLADKWKHPISFYGKVVDENTNPVAQATVTFIWNDTSESGSSKSSAKSDQNGFFSLSGVTGRGLSVYVEKAGYYYVKQGSQNDFDYSEGFVGDPGNPIIFRMRKKGAGIDLITSQHGVSPVLQIKSSPDGSPVRVDLFNQKVGADGQLGISQNKPAYGAWQSTTGWSYRLAIPSGGLVETTDEFAYEAPESGYQPAVEFKFQKGDTNWTERIDKTFYVAFGTPRKYGRLHVETTMTSGTILEYAINPAGSRNLEPR